MSRIVNFGNGITARQRDVIDDLKDAIKRYEFLENENERLIKDQQEQEKKIDFLKQQNHQLFAAIGRQVWEQISSSAMSRKANRRKWRAK
ncbi:Uncharacterised protein [Streptococcus suis]|uniref:hypothetical protein n=1 Tax=Streptococcus suis TaxID=1307 RepID=UPI0005CDE15F|nr:hypothetical protein [Streptococcus suis]NQI18312.1 hypothetical protein [Streptococcus suis]NQO74769.1 hypothetical protein [Streptococcus suis]NQP40307.1 hypothetical protein [Streptococcus suis]CYU40705.1 Uncharacterised protein [Streptococcus suis]HEP1568664.1 hypothetical protein [Streptococcus suis]